MSRRCCKPTAAEMKALRAYLKWAGHSKVDPKRREQILRQLQEASENAAKRRSKISWKRRQ